MSVPFQFGGDHDVPDGERPATKVGISVTCALCGLTKKPIGRSAALEMANSLCDYECSGYRQQPFVGTLWPGETDADFGYAVSDYGTKPVGPEGA